MSAAHAHIGRTSHHMRAHTHLGRVDRATVRHITLPAVPPPWGSIGPVYDSRLPAGYIVRELRQCQNCVRVFVGDVGDHNRYCAGCRGSHLSAASTMAWNRVRQLQAIAAPYVERDLHVKPRRHRTTQPLRDRLIEAFKASPDGSLTSSEIRKVAGGGESAPLIIARMQRQELWIVKVGERKMVGRPASVYAISD